MPTKWRRDVFCFGCLGKINMRINIVSKEENPLFNRTEVEFEVKETPKTPSRKDIRAQLAALVNADEKGMVVDVLRQGYGTSEVKGSARIYKSEKDMKRTEVAKVIIRNFGKEAVAKKKATPAAGAAPTAKK